MRTLLVLVVIVALAGAGCRQLAGYDPAPTGVDGGPAADARADGPPTDLATDLPPPPTYAWGHALGHLVGDAQVGGLAISDDGERYLVGTFSGRLGIRSKSVSAPEGQRGLFVYRYKAAEEPRLWGLSSPTGKVLGVRDAKIVKGRLVIAMQASGILELQSEVSLSNNAGVLLWLDLAELGKLASDATALKPAIADVSLVEEPDKDAEIWALATNDSYLYAVGELRDKGMKIAKQGFVRALPLSTTTTKPWAADVVASKGKLRLRGVVATKSYVFFAASGQGKLDYVRVNPTILISGSNDSEHLALTAVDPNDGSLYQAQEIAPTIVNGWLRGVALARGPNQTDLYLVTQDQNSDLSLELHSYDSLAPQWTPGKPFPLASHGEVQGRLDLVAGPGGVLLLAGDLEGGGPFANTSSSDHIAAAVLSSSNNDDVDKAVGHIALGGGLFNARIATNGGALVLAGSPKAGPFDVTLPPPADETLIVPPSSAFWTEWSGAPPNTPYQPKLVEAEGGMGTVRVEASALAAVGGDTLVYLVGSFEGTVDFDRADTKAWRRTAEARDGVVAAYDVMAGGSGGLRWLKRITSAGDVSPVDVTIDAKGQQLVVVARCPKGADVGIEDEPKEPSPLNGTACLISMALGDGSGAVVTRPITPWLEAHPLAVAARGGSRAIIGTVNGGSTGLDLALTVSGNSSWTSQKKESGDQIPRDLQFVADNRLVVAGQVRGGEVFADCGLPSVAGSDGVLATIEIQQNSGQCVGAQTYGGAGDDKLDSVVVLEGGELLIAGRYGGKDPITIAGAPLPAPRAARDGFVARVDKDGLAASWAQPLRSSVGLDAPLLLSVDPFGQPRVATSYRGTLELGSLLTPPADTSQPSVIFFAELHGESGTAHWRRDLRTLLGGAVVGVDTGPGGETLVAGLYSGRLLDQGELIPVGGASASFGLLFRP